MTTSRRVLMVSPHFPPDSSAASHRVRLLAPYLGEHGWEPTVVTVEPGETAEIILQGEVVAWYRERLHDKFMNVGGGMFLKQPVEVTVWAIDRI